MQVDFDTITFEEMSEVLGHCSLLLLMTEFREGLNQVAGGGSERNFGARAGPGSRAA